MELDLPQLQYPGNWNPRRGAVDEWSTELRLRTRLKTRRKSSVVKIDDPKLFASPFLYVAGAEHFPQLRPQQEARLRRFVDFGGMIVFDDADGGRSTEFRDGLTNFLTRALPGSALTPLPKEHVLYKSFYLIEKPQGRTRSFEQCDAVLEEGRIKVLYFPNDLGGALVRDERGQHIYPCRPGGEIQRQWAIRMAINILLYATCTDYKSDRAHVETLIRSRSWRSSH